MDDLYVTTDHREMVEEIEPVMDEICTEWECDFIGDMLDWDGDFTEKQQAVIERIYKKACDSPY